MTIKTVTLINVLPNVPLCFKFCLIIVVALIIMKSRYYTKIWSIKNRPMQKEQIINYK